MCERCKSFYTNHPLVPSDNNISQFIHSDTTYASPIKCCFDDKGEFVYDNWCYKTMEILRDLCNEKGYTYRDDMGNGSISVFSIPENDHISGYLVLCYYKDRGKTSQAYIMYEESSPIKLTETYANIIIDSVYGENTINLVSEGE